MKTMRFYLLFFSVLFLASAFNVSAFAERIAEREVLPNGLVLMHSEKKTLPVVNVVVAVKAGSFLDLPEKSGLAKLTAELLNEGTAKRSSVNISDEIEFVGGQLNISGGMDYITVTLTVLKKDLELGFDLLSDIILNPVFSPQEVMRKKTMTKGNITMMNDDPGVVASKAFQEAVYGEHPYAKPVEGLAETIDNITQQDIVDFHKSYYAPNNSLMAVVGDVSRRELKSLIDKYFKNWQMKEIKTRPLPDMKNPDRPLVLKINKNIAQANIILGHLGMRRDNPDYYASVVMNYILGGGGFASRLMDNIRDNKGLSYDVHSYFSSNKHGGNFQAGLQTKNHTANEAIAEIIKEMERIRKEPVTDKELSDAKSYLTGSFHLRLDSNSKIANFLIAVEFFGLGSNYVDDYKKYINAVSKDDILKTAQKYLNPEKYILVVVGDIDKASLKY
jgi:zinc protease